MCVMFSMVNADTQSQRYQPAYTNHLTVNISPNLSALFECLSFEDVFC